VFPAVPPDVPPVPPPVVPPLPFTEASGLIDDVLLPHAATTNDSADAITSTGTAPMPMPLERSD
jgi:hypothetical protein